MPLRSDLDEDLAYRRTRLQFGLESTHDLSLVSLQGGELSGMGSKTLEGHEDSVSSVSFSSDGKYIVTGSADNTAKIWRMPISDPQELLRITGEHTNARVCRDTLEVVNVLPFPDPMTVWAPEELCQPVE